MITLLSEALCFTTYLSLYLHKIVKFYFFCFLTFIFSFIIGVFWGGGKNILWLFFYQNIKIQQNILLMSAFFKRSKILITLVAFAAQNLTFL